MASDSVVIPCASCNSLNRVPMARLRDRPICADCRSVLVGGTPPELDARSFHRLTTRSDLPVVVDFWAAWCGPCKMMAPEFEKASGSLADVAVLAKLDTEKHGGVSGQFGVQSIPTMIVFRQGAVLAQQSGAMQQGQIEDWVRGVVG